ncbi:MAG: GlxA family transcriptional regulator [Actinomycetota bacterium]
MSTSRRVVLLGFEGVQSLDLVGPLEVFATATRLGVGAYETEVVAPGAEGFATTSGLRIAPDRSPAACRGPIDTLLVAGGQGVRAAAGDERLVRWLRGAAGRSRRVASVCTGAFLLAHAGLLDGRRATTHWASAKRLAAEYPSVEVEPDRIFVRDGEVWTSAGVTAGMDLALALVESDHGREASLEVARWLVLFVRRPGGQSQFSAPLATQAAEREPLREAQERVLADPRGDCTVETLAAAACMSPRNFSRAFVREVGLTPAAWVETVRVERAQRLLEAGSQPIEIVARECGFGTVETLRRAFGRRLGVSPGEYRERFRAALHDAA